MFSATLICSFLLPLSLSHSTFPPHVQPRLFLLHQETRFQQSACCRREMELMVGTGPFSDCIPHRRPRGNSNWATQVGAGLKPELLPLPGHRAPDSDGRGGRNPKTTTAHPAALVTSIRASYTWKNPSPSRAGQQMSKRKTLPLAHLRHILPSEGGNRTPRSLAALKDTVRNEASSP
mgnify:CR=1 FL=1|jgi:hypothetical protein